MYGVYNHVNDHNVNDHHDVATKHHDDIPVFRSMHLEMPDGWSGTELLDSNSVRL
jgi:hypothetical protein